MNKADFKVKQFFVVLPVLLVILIIPLSTSYKQVISNYKRSDVFTNITTYLDFFGWWKSVTLLVLSGFIFLLNFLFVKKGQKLPLIIYINLAIYMIFMLLSAYFSEYREITWVGAPNYFEGVPILLCYLNLFYYSAKHLTLESVKYIILALGVSVFIMSIIGIPQYFGYYIYQESPIKEFFTANLKIYNIKFHWSDKGFISTTLFNPNMLGCYCALLTPIFINSFLNSSKKWVTVLLFLFCLCSFICLNGSVSRSAVLGTIMATFIIFAYNFKRILQKYLRITVLAVSYLIAMFIFGETMNAHLKNMFDFLIIPEKNIEKLQVATEQPKKIRKAKVLETINKDLIYDAEDLYFKFTTSDPKLGIQVFDRQGSLVQFTQINQNTFKPNDPRYSDISIGIGKIPHGSYLVFQEFNKNVFNFVLTPIGFKFFIWNGFFDSQPAPKVDLIAELAFSKRGYMWNRTLPMLGDCLLLGKGPQTFSFYFPQKDFLGKYNVGFTMDTIVDRPHCWYFLTAHDSGIVSLVALLIIFAYVLLNSFFSLSKNFSSISKIHIYLIGFSASVVSYLVTLVFNDSYIGLAPLFWIVLGVNLMLVQSYKLR
ncbi:MAG: O-antigen ligase family protein [Silvanigrellaceae bacterium]|nr:O-antigen ligase family protein [Silvanigrellaceae bacterium]